MIIGNPPYLEYTRERFAYALQRGAFSSEPCGNLYAFIIERCLRIGCAAGKQGFIVPTSSMSTERMKPLQKLLANRSMWYSTFGFRPSKLFEGATTTNLHLSILLLNGYSDRVKLSLPHIKWKVDYRPYLFAALPIYSQASSEVLVHYGKIPRLASPTHELILRKLSSKPAVSKWFGETGNAVYYRATGGLHYRVFTTFSTASREEREVQFLNSVDRDVAFCAYASNLWNMFYYTYSECLHVSKFEMDQFPLGLRNMDRSAENALVRLARSLDADIKRHATLEVRNYRGKGAITDLGEEN